MTIWPTPALEASYDIWTFP